MAETTIKARLELVPSSASVGVGGNVFSPSEERSFRLEQLKNFKDTGRLLGGLIGKLFGGTGSAVGSVAGGAAGGVASRVITGGAAGIGTAIATALSSPAALVAIATAIGLAATYGLNELLKKMFGEQVFTDAYNKGLEESKRALDEHRSTVNDEVIARQDETGLIIGLNDEMLNFYDSTADAGDNVDKLADKTNKATTEQDNLTGETSKTTGAFSELRGAISTFINTLKTGHVNNNIGYRSTGGSGFISALATASENPLPGETAGDVLRRTRKEYKSSGG